MDPEILHGVKLVRNEYSIPQKVSDLVLELGIATWSRTRYLVGVELIWQSHARSFLSGIKEKQGASKQNGDPK